MTVRSKSEIKQFFQRGDFPSESQFVDLIDSYADENHSHTINEIEGLSSTLVSLCAAGTGTEIQYRNDTVAGAVPGSSVSGSTVTFDSIVIGSTIKVGGSSAAYPMLQRFGSQLYVIRQDGGAFASMSVGSLAVSGQGVFTSLDPSSPAVSVSGAVGQTGSLFVFFDSVGLLLAEMKPDGVLHSKAKVLNREPTSADVSSGSFFVVKNTSLNETRIWFNDNGTMKKSAAFT